MQGGDQVVVFFSLFVIQEGFFGSALFDRFVGDPGFVAVGNAVQDGHFQRRKSAPGVSVRKDGDGAEEFVGNFDFLRPESAFVPKRAAEQLFDLFRFQRLQDKHFATGEECAVDLKRRVFRRRADENNAALFDEGQEGILLRFVEAVNFIDEQNGFFAEPPALFRLFHHLLDFFDSAGDGGEVDEIGFGAAGDDPRERGFADARRPPENHGADVVAFDEAAQNPAFSQQVFLPAVFVQRLRPQPRRQGLTVFGFKNRSLNRHGFRLVC